VVCSGNLRIHQSLQVLFDFVPKVVGKLMFGAFEHFCHHFSLLRKFSLTFFVLIAKVGQNEGPFWWPKFNSTYEN
jgi:hypothetical protein